MRTIDTYERFDRHVKAWAVGEIQTLVVQGSAGIGKSSAAKEALTATRHHWFSARQSPVTVYNALYDQPDLPIIFDDISALLKDGNFIDMLKGLCETTDRKTICWGTTTAKLEGRATDFTTNSRVLVLLNKLPEKNPDVMAVLDRADCIRFAPTKAEVIRRMHCIFPDDGDLISLMAELPVMPSLRTLIKGKQWQKSKHLSLTEELFSECGVPEPVATLVEIMRTSPEAAWLTRYVTETGLMDRSYRRHKALAEQLLACRTNGQAYEDAA